MRILHVSDIRGHRLWLDWISREAGKYDVCCFTGNVFPFEAPTDSSYVQWIQNQLGFLENFSARLCVCTGPLDFLSATAPEAFRGNQWIGQIANPLLTIDQTVGLPGGWQIQCWPHFAPASCWSLGLPTVALVNAPPANCSVARGKLVNKGSKRSADILAGLRPGSILLSGQIASPETWCENVDGVLCFVPGFYHLGAIPNHVVIDTDTKTARCFCRQKYLPEYSWR